MAKSQSAMEYLMTYGWAVLVIGIAITGLSVLGIFNSDNYAPKQLSGSCYVQKNLVNTYLVGTCNKGLPKFVARFSGNDSYANMGNSYLLSPEAGATGNMTLCIWYRILNTTGYRGPVIKGQNAPTNGDGWEYTIDQQGANHAFTVWNSGGANIANGGSGANNEANIWQFVCFTYDYANSVAYYYYNSTQYNTTFTVSAGPASQKTGNFIVGAGESGYSNILAADVQMYNSSLTQGQIHQLYMEGIGGAPIQLQNLVGWWPLNGDAKDYSGENNNGNAVNVAWSTTWYSTYHNPPVS